MKKSLSRLGWDSTKSLKLSIVCTWAAIIALIVAVPLLPFLSKLPLPEAALRFNAIWMSRALAPLYLCLVAGLAALILLLRLLTDISHDQIFITANVRRLRAISWCGFAIALLGLLLAFIAGPWVIFIILAAAAAFMGLLMRVVKNVIDAARLLKEDADYTI